MPIKSDQGNFTTSPSSAEVKVSLSKVDEDAIRSLAGELGAPVGLIAEVYARGLAQLAPHTRVKAFLPLVVGRLVRRRTYVSPTTGQSVVIDNTTGQVIDEA